MEMQPTGPAPCISRKTVHFFFFFKMYLFSFWLCWVSVTAQAFSGRGQQGLLFVVLLELLVAVTSLVVEHRLSSCGTRA